MTGYHIVFIETGALGSGQDAPPSPARPGQTAPTRDEIREQVRQSIQGVTEQVRVDMRQMRDAQQRVRDAEQQVRDAQQQLRNARTADQRGAAQQSLEGARAELRALQGGGVIVHTGQPMGFARDVIPPQAVDISIAFFIMLAVIIIGWPLARAWGRRLERRADLPAVPTAAMASQLQRIEQAVEAMSIEVERISESQRFMAKLQSGSAERAALETGERR
ncbi:MAG TPA: hypothetical protein VM033_00455 [Gemmatimonadaceae bacterium]|nr:hypothetical protein [Gemmatimonadaceae bacterium]